MTIAVESQFKQLQNNVEKSFPGPQSDSICIPFSSYHFILCFIHGLMKSISWSALSVWVFIAQLVEHCSTNTEAMGLNPVEKIFFGLLHNCLNCDSTAMVTYSFHKVALLMKQPRLKPQTL